MFSFKKTQENHSNTGKKQMIRMTGNFSWGRNGSFSCPAEGKAFGVGATLAWRAIAITSTKDSASPSRQSGWSLQAANRTWRTPILVVYRPPPQPLPGISASGRLCQEDCGKFEASLDYRARPYFKSTNKITGNILWGNSMGFPPKNLLNLFSIYYCFICYYLYKE